MEYLFRGSQFYIDSTAERRELYQEYKKNYLNVDIASF